MPGSCPRARGRPAPATTSLARDDPAHHALSGRGRALSRCAGAGPSRRPLSTSFALDRTRYLAATSGPRIPRSRVDAETTRVDAWCERVWSTVKASSKVAHAAQTMDSDGVAATQPTRLTPRASSRLSPAIAHTGGTAGLTNCHMGDPFEPCDDACDRVEPDDGGVQHVDRSSRCPPLSWPEAWSCSSFHVPFA